MKKKIFLIALTFILPFFLTGCSIRLRTGNEDGGVFKSFDKGATWQQKVFVSQVKKKVTAISDVDVTNIAINNNDSNFIYLGTLADGLWQSFDGGEKWTSVLTNKGKINSIAFDSSSSSIAYVSMGNIIFKTADKGKNWKKIYLDAGQQAINALAVDSNDTSKIYAGLNDGRFINSTDYGETWQVLKNFSDVIKQILITKNNSKIIYVATANKGFYQTIDGGNGWLDLTLNQKFSGIRSFKFAVFDKTKNNSLIIATKYGLLKTKDAGITWEEIKLLTLPGKADILSLVINPSNANEIYYGTNLSNHLLRTKDGGETWETIDLNDKTKRKPVYLAIDQANPDVLYLGVAKID